MQKNTKLYKSGSLSEFYNNKSIKSFKNTGNNNDNFDMNKKIIKVNIISKIQKELLIQKIKSEISNNDESEVTEMEIYNTQTIGNLIKQYCNKKEIKIDNLYLTKKDLKKINNNLTIIQAKIENNETVFIFNGSENEKRSEIVEEN